MSEPVRDFLRMADKLPLPDYVKDILADMARDPHLPGESIDAAVAYLRAQVDDELAEILADAWRACGG